MPAIHQQKFETLNFNPFQNILLSNNVDPDINLFNKEFFQTINGDYYFKGRNFRGKKLSQFRGF